MKTETKPQFGKLVYHRPDTGLKIVIDRGPFALMQHKRNQLKHDPQYAKGKLIITY